VDVRPTGEQALLRLTTGGEGTSEIQRLVIARQVLAEERAAAAPPRG
jgi:alkylation response protein AidB-like acyl-CoA dehydrogenase